MPESAQRRHLLAEIMETARRLDSLQARLADLGEAHDDERDDEDNDQTIVDHRSPGSPVRSESGLDETTLPLELGHKKRPRMHRRRVPIPAPHKPPRPALVAVEDSPGLKLSIPPARVSLEGTQLGHAVSRDEFSSRYSPGDLLGEGGMGEVRVYTDSRIGRDVAIKTLLEDARDSTRYRERFLFEARVQGQLEHPGVVPVYEIGKLTDGSEFLSMKRLAGQTLRQVINDLRDGNRAAMATFTRRRLLSAFQSLCLTVDYAHQRGVVHRDIKPTNVMLGNFGEVYLLDWGVAKLVESVDEPRAPGTVQLDREHEHTEVGEVLGTPGYMSPEQAAGTGQIDGRSDVFSLGAILFEILTLERLVPYQEGDLTELTLLGGYDAHISERFPELDVPAELEQVCVEATEHDPDARATSARAIHDAIERFLEGEGDAKRRLSMSRKHTRAAIAALAEADLVDGATGSPTVPAAQRSELRRLAIQEVTRALALDPKNRVAMQTLFRLITDAPEEPSPDAARALTSNEQESLRKTAWRGAIGYGMVTANLALAAFLGLRDPAVFAVPLVFLSAAALVSLFISRQAAPDRRLAFPIVALATLGFGFTGALFGPFTLAPTLCAVHVLLVSVLLDRAVRYFAVAAGVFAVALPMLLSTAGVVSPSWVFEGGIIHVLPRVVEFPEVPTMAFLALVLLGAVVLPALLVGPERDTRVAAERKLTLQAFQMAEFLPPEARETLPSLAPGDSLPPPAEQD